MSAIVNSAHASRLQAQTGSFLNRPAVSRRGAATACEWLAVTRASDRQADPSRENRIIEQTRTYNEAEGKLYSKSSPPEDDEGSIALLVPGGRVSDRPSQAGGAAAAARREQSKPLKIDTDLRLVRNPVVCCIAVEAVEPSICSHSLLCGHIAASSVWMRKSHRNNDWRGSRFLGVRDLRGHVCAGAFEKPKASWTPCEAVIQSPPLPTSLAQPLSS